MHTVLNPEDDRAIAKNQELGPHIRVGLSEECFDSGNINARVPPHPPAPANHSESSIHPGERTRGPGTLALVAASRSIGSNPRRMSDRVLFDLAQAIIKSQFAQRALDLTYVAQLLHVSRWRLSRAFSRTGVDFRSCVRHVRMLEAARRLYENVAVKEVSIDVGYRHPTDFTKHFKESWGVTPTAFRDYHRGRAGKPSEQGSLAHAGIRSASDHRYRSAVFHSLASRCQV